MLDKGIENASFGLEAAKETQKASRSGWYPKADITLNSARQEDFNPNAANKKYNPTEAKIKVTQKLWDFGETSAAIKTSGLARTMAEIGLNGAKNQAILKAAQAYIGLKKAYAQYKIARDVQEAQLKNKLAFKIFVLVEARVLERMFCRPKMHLQEQPQQELRRMVAIEWLQRSLSLFSACCRLQLMLCCR